MDRWLVAVVAGLAGGIGGSLAVQLVTPPRAAPGVAGGTDESLLRDVGERLAAIEGRLARPAPSLVAPGEPAGEAGTSSRGRGPSREPGDAEATSPSQLEAVATRAAEKALELRAAKEATGETAGRPPGKKRATLAEVSRELALTSAQEDEVRRAYSDATEKYLKILAEPESDAETLRRELEAAKDDPGKKMGIAVRFLPKLMTKLGDVMAVEAEKSSRVAKAVGPDKYARYEGYRVAEEDPFGMDGSFSLGASAGN